AGTDTSFSIQVGAKDGETISISIGGASGSGNSTAAGGWNMLTDLAAGTQGNLAAGDTRGVSSAGFDVLQEDALAILDERLSTVDKERSNLGAMQNRFETALDNIQTTSTNLQAARSRIEDADYAVEVSNLTRAQILEQAGTSILAQANQSPQSVLSLLQ
ncbi:flagellin, partial [Vreelandella zhaodongensis]